MPNARKTSAVLSAVIVTALSALPAFADVARDTGLTATAKGAGLKTGRSLPSIVGGLIQGIFGLLGIIFSLLIIYAGFLWMTAQGTEEKVKRAKNIITSAVIGLVIIVASYAIVGYVVALVAGPAAPGSDVGQPGTTVSDPSSPSAELPNTGPDGTEVFDTGPDGQPCPPDDPLCGL